MTEPVGGYFSLELPLVEEYHKYALRLNTGRNCLEYILESRGYKKVYLPYYICSVVLEPFEKLGVQYVFYHVDERLELKDKPSVKAGEALLYVNYFGLKQRYVEHLAEQYGTSLIIDNTQAFYAKPVKGIDTFYSCRKFFGVPDGAYLYTDKLLGGEFEQDESYDRMSHLLRRIDQGAESGYDDFRKNDDLLSGQPVRRMSRLTHRLMRGIDYEGIASRRRANYRLLESELGESNKIFLDLEEDAVPMVYPYLTSVKGLRERLIADKVFVACYWPDVLDWVNEVSLEYFLASQMLPLPVDQRYGEEVMNGMVKELNDLKCKG
jgi:hypothetical protein